MNEIIFGPVASRRFGTSLGIDLSPGKKRCNFDCLYCELAPQAAEQSSDTTLTVQEVTKALDTALTQHGRVDVITVTANGEPTLYPHFRELVAALQPYRTQAELLILTNSATLSDPLMQKILQGFDQVKCSLDAVSEKTFIKIDRPHPSITIESIVRGLQLFANEYSGKLIIEVLAVAGVNDTLEEMQRIAEVVRPLEVFRLDMGTIDRPPAYGVHPVANEKLEALASPFEGINLHIAKRKEQSFTQSHFTREEILNTLDKRPLTKEDVTSLFDIASHACLETLLAEGEVALDGSFYRLAKNIGKKRQKA